MSDLFGISYIQSSWVQGMPKARVATFQETLRAEGTRIMVTVNTINLAMDDAAVAEKQRPDP